MVAAQLLGHTVFNGLLATVSATVVALALLLEPVVATGLAWWLLDELPGTWSLAAPRMVLAGVGWPRPARDGCRLLWN